MNVRIGTDLVNIKRFGKKLENSPAIFEKLFQPAELKNSDPSHLAGIFTAKEAAAKALELASGSWLEMEVGYYENGKPFVKFSKNIKVKPKSFDLSIAHDGDYAIATFIAILK